MGPVRRSRREPPDRAAKLLADLEPGSDGSSPDGFRTVGARVLFSASTTAAGDELFVTDILAEGGAKPEHLVRLTWYVVDIEEYLASLKELGRVYREIFGAHYPAMALVQVVRLVEKAARVEIEATAVVPR